MPPASVDDGDDAMQGIRRTPSLLLSRLRTMAAMITDGMELTGAGMVLQPAPASVDASGADSSGPEPKTEAAASDDTASAGRPAILKPEGGRPSASDASASAADDSFGRLPKVSFASDDARGIQSYSPSSCGSDSACGFQYWRTCFALSSLLQLFRGKILLFKIFWQKRQQFAVWFQLVALVLTYTRSGFSLHRFRICLSSLANATMLLGNMRIWSANAMSGAVFVLSNLPCTQMVCVRQLFRLFGPCFRVVSVLPATAKPLPGNLRQSLLQWLSERRFPTRLQKHVQSSVYNRRGGGASDHLCCLVSVLLLYYFSGLVSASGAAILSACFAVLE